MSLGSRTRVLMADWSVQELPSIREGDMIMGYAKAPEGLTYQLLPSSVISLYSSFDSGESSRTFRFLFKEGTRIICDQSQKFWIDRIRNGRVWTPPAKPGFDPYFTRSILIRAGHQLRGVGRSFATPESNEEWQFGYNMPLKDIKGTSVATQSYDVCRGFLSSVFDRFGSITSPHCFVICTTKNQTEYVCEAISKIGFNVETEQVDGKTKIKVAGNGLDPLRFLFCLGLKTEEKRDELAARCFKGSRIELISVEEGTVNAVYSLMTGTGNFIAEGLVVKSDDFRELDDLVPSGDN